MIIDEGHKIVYSGQDKYHQQGVTFIVRKELTKSIYQLQDNLQQNYINKNSFTASKYDYYSDLCSYKRL